MEYYKHIDCRTGETLLTDTDPFYVRAKYDWLLRRGYAKKIEESFDPATGNRIVTFYMPCDLKYYFSLTV